jgi:hypothetical protein
MQSTSDIFNQQYLLNKQYNTSANLNARIQLHERFRTNPTDWHRWAFDQIEMRQLEGGLAVTEAEPLIAYILSSRAPGSISETQLQSLRTLIDRELTAHGVVHITTESGLFIASGQPG